MADAYTTSTTKSDPVEIKCAKCGRFGRYRRATLIKRFGPDKPMPTVLTELASDCPNSKEPVCWTDPCGAAQDYAIYEGTIGSWYDHSRIDCTDDGGDMEEQVQPAPVVVPNAQPAAPQP